MKSPLPGRFFHNPGKIRHSLLDSQPGEIHPLLHIHHVDRNSRRYCNWCIILHQLSNTNFSPFLLLRQIISMINAYCGWLFQSRRPFMAFTNCLMIPFGSIMYFPLLYIFQKHSEPTASFWKSCVNYIFSILYIYFSAYNKTLT